MIRRVLVTFLGLWAFFCVCLFYWIGLLGEAFRFDVSSLVFLRLGVSFWAVQACVVILMLVHVNEGLTRRMRLFGIYFGCAGILFDVLLGFFGQSVSLIFWAIPAGHGVGSLLFWRTAR
ncbi:MAG: hypothetical protein ACPGQS_11995 [Bradymonadia bacterium]